MPLEVINPACLLPYLPHGKLAFGKQSFMQRAKSLVARDTFLDLFLNDTGSLFESLSVEFCFELGQPGKALILLIEALQARQIHVNQPGSISSDATQSSAKSGLNLPWIALEAAEQAIWGG